MMLSKILIKKMQLKIMNLKNTFYKKWFPNNLISKIKKRNWNKNSIKILEMNFYIKMNRIQLDLWSFLFFQK